MDNGYTSLSVPSLLKRLLLTDLNVQHIYRIYGSASNAEAFLPGNRITRHTWNRKRQTHHALDTEGLSVESSFGRQILDDLQQGMVR